MNKVKNIITITLFAVVCFGFSAVVIFGSKKDYSMTERRSLKKAPVFSVQSLLSGKFMSDFDDFTLDQFPLRDGFRSVKANFDHYFLLKKDNHGLYLTNGYLSKMEYPENDDFINRNLNKLNSVYKEYLKDSDCKIYLSVIPDKNYFLAPLGNYPVMNYEKVISTVKTKLNYAEYIDIFPLLKLDDYYYTDQHWRQENLEPVAKKIGEKMGTDLLLKMKTETLENPFYGTYYGQASLNVKPDTIQYLTDSILENTVVTSYNSGSPKEAFMYDMKKAFGRDPYEMFLGGADPLITIENKNADSEKELVIFRDSFGSSLVPLFVSAYSKITLIDLRYIQSGMIKNYLEFSNQDVLFLYSTLILNNQL